MRARTSRRLRSSLRNVPIIRLVVIITPGVPTPRAGMQAWLAWIRELESKGHLKNRGQPLERTGKVVRGRKKLVTDGPYVEAKDLVLGFITVDAQDLAQATTLAEGCPMLEGDGSVEIRPVGEL